MSSTWALRKLDVLGANWLKVAATELECSFHNAKRQAMYTTEYGRTSTISSRIEGFEKFDLDLVLGRQPSP